MSKKNFDLQASNVETATFGMGWFWGPDARFGHLPGVIRTRVGFSGGTTPSPTYRRIGDHTETLEIDFDPSLISYEEILNVFWGNHNPLRENFYKGRQYISILLYHNQHQQQDIIKRKKSEWSHILNGEIQTEIAPYSTFYLAEDYHQKYYLRRFKNAFEKLDTIFTNHSDFVNSTLTARLNGLAKGHGTLSGLREEINTWGLNKNDTMRLIEMLSKIRWWMGDW